MLNKQGLFSRNNASKAGRSPDSSPNSPNKPILQPLSPGHFAAMESATTPASGTELKAKPETTSGSRLIVGPDVKLKGAEIQDCDTLIVEGRVEATMDSRVIQISEHGAFSGKVGIDVAEVYGQFDGELTARSQLIIHASGRVSGKIRYGKIFIEEGGEVSGDIASLTAENSKVISPALRGVVAKQEVATS